MSVQLLAAWFAVCYSLTGQVEGGHVTCLRNDCVPGNQFAACILDPQNTWQCPSGQFCHVTMDVNHLHSSCQDTKHLTDCTSHRDRNAASCSLITGSSTHGACTFCCGDKQCMENLASTSFQTLGEVTAPTHTPMTSSPVTSSTAVMTPRPVPGRHSCHTSDCDHGTDLAACVSGHFACGDGEFCEAHIHNNAIDMKCKAVHEFATCQHHETANPGSCLSFPPVGDCRFCCTSQACSLPQLIPSTTPSTTQTPTTSLLLTSSPTLMTWTQGLVPGFESCYTSDCGHGISPASCMSGQYACGTDQFCEAHIHGFHMDMRCKPLQELLTCRSHLWHNDPAVCGTHPTTGDCRYCCTHHHCMPAALGSPAALTSSLVSSQSTTPLPATTTSRPTTLHHTHAPTTTTTTTAAPATTPSSTPPPLVVTTPSAVPVTTAAHHPHHPNHRHCFTSPPCHDDTHLAACLTGDWACGSGEFCSLGLDTNGQKQIQCQPLLVFSDCKLHEELNDLKGCPPSGLAGGHHCRYCCLTSHCVHGVARHFLNATLTTTTPTITPTTTSIANSSFHTSPSSQPVTKTPSPVSTVGVCHDLYKGDCGREFAGRCGEAVIQSVCQKTCGICAPPSTSPAVSTIPATTAPDTSSPAPRPIECVQCGNYGNGTACSDDELLLSPPIPCTDPHATFCMSDVLSDSTSAVTVFKRCARPTSCIVDWYQQTSDKHACVTFSINTPTPSLNCHFCCLGDGCNLDFVPDSSTWWHP